MHPLSTVEMFSRVSDVTIQESVLFCQCFAEFDRLRVVELATDLATSFRSTKMDLEYIH